MTELDELLRALLDERLEWTDFLELLAVRAGRKSVVRLTGQPDRLEELSRLAQMIDLPCAVAPLHLEGVFVTSLRDRFSRLRPGFPGAGEEGILFIGREEGISRALDMEGEGCPPDAAARLYGYPQCCARVYQNRIQNGQCPWVDSFLAEVRGVAHFPWQMNRMGRLFAPYLSILPDYFPCSPRCAESLNMAESYADLLHEAGLSMLEKLIRMGIENEEFYDVAVCICCILCGTPSLPETERICMSGSWTSFPMPGLRWRVPN